MGWWKMVISHLKHSHLNWRVIPCKRKKKWFVCIQFSSFFFNICLLSWFLFRPDRIFQVHDMTINFFSFFFYAHDLSASNNDAYPRWTSSLKYLFSYEDHFERVGFWFEVACIIFCPKEKYGSKVFSRNGQFLVNMPQSINRGDFRISWS